MLLLTNWKYLYLSITGMLYDRRRFLTLDSSLFELGARTLRHFDLSPSRSSSSSTCAFPRPIRYVVLWAQGLRHTVAAYYHDSSSSGGLRGDGGEDSLPVIWLRRDVGQLCALYALESALAMGCGLSTLANWRLVGRSIGVRLYCIY